MLGLGFLGRREWEGAKMLGRHTQKAGAGTRRPENQGLTEYIYVAVACSFLAKESQAKHENYIQNKHAPHRE